MKYVKIEGGRKLSNFITPMLATLSDEPAFDSDDWLFEIKWDGYRAIAEIDGQGNKLYSRNGLTFDKAYPKVFAELSKIKHKAVIDGEIVVVDNNGLPSFQALQNYKNTQKVPLQFYVFDCLSLDGKDLSKLSLIERKNILQKIIPTSNIIRYCDHVLSDGVALFNQVKQLNIEGIIGKKINSKYYSGKRSNDWLKIKNVNTDDFVIVGWTDPQGSREYFGALLLAKQEGRKLKYAGTVGTGYTSKLLKEIIQLLRPIARSTSPLKEEVKEKGIHWVDPYYVCQVQYTELTNEGHVRHPSYQGLRRDKKYVLP